MVAHLILTVLLAAIPTGTLAGDRQPFAGTQDKSKAKKSKPKKIGDGLLTDPVKSKKDRARDVFTTKLQARSLPGLAIETTVEGKGKNTLQFGKIGVIHIKGRLTNGKEFKNTYADTTPPVRS